MTSEAPETAAVSSRESLATPWQFAYALVLVGAGLLAVLALLYGVAHVQNGGSIWVAVGAVCYLAVWGWGIRLAMSD